VGPSVAVAAVRCAVRDALADGAGLVLVACSGGADSVALAAAAAFEAPRLGLRVGGVTIDHGLQKGSVVRAAAVADLLVDLGLDPVEAVAVEVAGPGGPEAAARAARYAALDAAADRLHAATVLLGHTLDDQAETVLLGLARGSGTRSLAGMAATTGAGGRYRRPLLSVERALTRAACADLGLPVWDDPHNVDPAYARARVRADVLPMLESALGPGIAAALARTADLARADADALDQWAARVYSELASSDRSLEVQALMALPSAVRRRVFRLAALGAASAAATDAASAAATDAATDAGSPAGSLGAVHLAAIDALVTGWHGQGAVSLPGGRTVARRYGRLCFGTDEP
jgi:tRNA(Ile)-lysidine synthase